jgi:hypothetical protein
MVASLVVELPGDLGRFRLPEGVNARLRAILDRQDAGEVPTADTPATAKRSWWKWW